MRAHAKKVKDEGHWKATIDGQVVAHYKHDTPKAALDSARWHLVERHHLEPGEERLVSELSREWGLPRRYIESIPDHREGYDLHVADQVGNGVFPLPKRDWTLYREPTE